MQNNNQRRSPSHGTSEGTTYEGTALEMISIKDTVAPQNIYIYIYFTKVIAKGKIYIICVRESIVFFCPNVLMFLSFSQLQLTPSVRNFMLSLLLFLCFLRKNKFGFPRESNQDFRGGSLMSSAPCHPLLLHSKLCS